MVEEEMEPAFVSELVGWLHISISGQVEFPLHSPEMVDCPAVALPSCSGEQED